MTEQVDAFLKVFRGGGTKFGTGILVGNPGFKKEEREGVYAKAYGVRRSYAIFL